MRLPLGLLTGVGFIGGGVILQQGGRVLGITTAATLWFVTVLGLCFGGGQIALGLAALVGGLAVVWGLGWAERYMHQVQHGSLALSGSTERLQPAGLEHRLQSAGYTVVGQEATFTNGGRSCERRLRLRWRGHYGEERQCPDFLAELAATPGIAKVEWKP
jgi:putative Mg2+ transporter-C (MgtC) family protein